MKKQSSARAAKRAKLQAAYKRKQFAKRTLGVAALMLVLLGVVSYWSAPKRIEPANISGNRWTYPEVTMKEPAVKATMTAGKNEGSYMDATETVDAPYVGSNLTGGEVEFLLDDLGDSAEIIEATTPYVEVVAESVNLDQVYGQEPTAPVQQEAVTPVEVYTEPVVEVQEVVVEKTFEELNQECIAAGGDGYDPAVGGCVIHVDPTTMSDDHVVDTSDPL